FGSQVRQFSAVLLRRLLKRLRPELIQRLPTLLVEALEEEPDPAVRLSLVHLGAQLLPRAGPRIWAPLGRWVEEAAAGGDPRRKEGALQLLGVAVGVAPALVGVSRSPAHLLGLLRGGLRAGNSPGILQKGLRALGGVVGALPGGGPKNLLRSVVPDVLRALRELLEFDEDLCADALEVLDEFLEANPEALIPHLEQMLDFLLQVAGDESRGDPVRVRALATVTFLGQKRPRALLRGGLLQGVLGGLLTPLCSELRPDRPDPEEEEEEEGEGRGGPSPRHAAAQALDALAQGLPPEKLLRILVPLLEGRGRAATSGGRKGALLALGALARGCGAPLRRRYLGVVLGALRAGLGDPEPAVRGAAASALRSLGEELQPEAGAVAAEALPGVLEGFGGSQIPPPKSWFVLETLLECLGEGVQPWLPRVLPVILGALDPSGPPKNVEFGLSALHSLASSLGEQLSPHRGQILGALTPLVGPPRTPEERARSLQALGVLGALGVAVVGEGLREFLELSLELAREEQEGEGPDTEGRRVAFQLAGAVSELEGAGPELLPRVLPLLQGALQPPRALLPPEAPDWLLRLDDGDEGAEPMDDDVTEEEAELVEVEVGGAYVELVEAALGALGELGENCRSAFEPYLEPTLAAILELTQFPQYRVRAAAYEALGGLCRGMDPQTVPLPVQQGALQALVGGVRSDPDVGGARGALEGIGRILEPPGPAHHWLEPIGRALCDVIKGEITCFKAPEDDEEEEEEETSARAELREAAGDWLEPVGVALGGVAFAPLFRSLVPALSAALGAGRGGAGGEGAGLRSWAAALLAQGGGAAGVGVAPELPRLGAALRLAAADAEPEVRANAFYAIGRLAEAAGHALDLRVWPGAELCRHALSGGEGPGRSRDNACGALVRHQGALPPSQVVPLVLRALPLTHDPEEEPPVGRYLLGVPLEELLPHTAELVRACGESLGVTALSQSLLPLLRAVGGANPAGFREGVARLGPAQAARLEEALRATPPGE
ncbi:importin-4, partial [Manacus candei]|uniref:importin-4 n=1 Tax=Manacus candei TaxID=415023 RepID=UPI002226FC48